MKISENLVKFAAGNMELYTGFLDYWNHYQALTNKKAVEFDTKFSLEEKETKLNAAIKREILRKANVPYAAETPVEQWFNHPIIVHETFAVVGAMIDMVLPDSIIETNGAYADTRTIGWGDSTAFDVEPRDLFVVSRAGHGQRSSEVRKQFKGQVTILPEMREITVGVSLYKVLSGKESLAVFVTKAVRSIEYQMNLDIYNVFATAMSGLSSTATTGLQVAGYTQYNLTRLAEQVTVWNQGAKAIVMGTSLGLLNVLPDDANYRYQLSDPYVQLGYIPTISGYDIMRLPQAADWQNTYGTLLSNSTLWIVSPSSQKLVKVVLEGNTLSNTTGTFDYADLTQNTTLFKSYGIGIATNAVAGQMTL